MAQFDAKAYRAQNPEEKSLPTGWYRVKCESSELKKTQVGQYDMVTLKIRIVDSISGLFINAIQWENLTIGHSLEQTRKFANDKLAEIMLACGVDVVEVWGDIAEFGTEFAMSVGRSQQTGRVYAIYRPLSAYLAVAAKAEPRPAPFTNGEAPVMPPAPPLEDYSNDIPY